MLKSNAQTFENNFLGDDFMLYKGVYFKLKEDAISGFNHVFYEDIKYCQSLYDKKVIYPETKFFFRTEKDSLANKIFLVDKIISKNGNVHSGLSSLYDNPIFILKDTVTKKIIYYKYDKQYEFNFPFITTKINFDEKAFCTKIESQKDDFTNVLKFNSPISNNYEISPMIIYKEINDSKSKYFLSLRTNGSTVNVDGTGVIILFSDGSKWTKPVKINVKAGKDNFIYTAFINLTPEDLNIFSTKKIKKYRLYIYDEIINPSDADKFNIYVNCIKNKL